MNAQDDLDKNNENQWDLLVFNYISVHDFGITYIFGVCYVTVDVNIQLFL